MVLPATSQTAVSSTSALPSGAVRETSGTDGATMVEYLASRDGRRQTVTVPAGMHLVIATCTVDPNSSGATRLRVGLPVTENTPSNAELYPEGLEMPDVPEGVRVIRCGTYQLRNAFYVYFDFEGELPSPEVLDQAAANATGFYAGLAPHQPGTPAQLLFGQYWLSTTLPETSLPAVVTAG